MKIVFLLLLILSVFIVQPIAATASDPAASEEGEANETFDLRFPGGTLRELVQHVRAQADRPPPMILGDGADLVEIGPMEISGGTVEQVYSALLWYLDRSVDQSAGITFSQNSGVWIVNAAPRSLPKSPQPEGVTRIFQIGPFLADFRLEDITTAIETAWEMASVEENGILRYHQETHLLYVRGSATQLQLVENVLAELRGELEGLRETRQARQLMEARIEAALEATRRELEAAEVFLQRMRKSPSEKGGVEQNEKWVEELKVARSRLLEMRDRLGDGHPALEEYLKTMEKRREFVTGQRFRITRLMDANDR